eukprot:m.45006 g.45006  ORF g.45006 m.45006 type:complete len:192 (-) comp15106_c0_seq1:75-650(-)
MCIPSEDADTLVQEHHRDVVKECSSVHVCCRDAWNVRESTLYTVALPSADPTISLLSSKESISVIEAACVNVDCNCGLPKTAPRANSLRNGSTVQICNLFSVSSQEPVTSTRQPLSVAESLVSEGSHLREEIFRPMYEIDVGCGFGPESALPRLDIIMIFCLTKVAYEKVSHFADGRFEFTTSKKWIAVGL